jgi:nucleoside-diphosphate kinase
MDTRQRSFIMVKPDAVQRGLIHKVILRLERRGFTLVAMKLTQPGRAHFEKHYDEHKGKPFFDKLVTFASSGPVCAMVWEGDNIIETSRTIIGATDPKKAEIGTIRGDYGLDMGRNAIHGSDAVESAAREIQLWFS